AAPARVPPRGGPATAGIAVSDIMLDRFQLKLKRSRSAGGPGQGLMQQEEAGCPSLGVAAR
ncbi:MAG: hypothetical protein ACR2O4_11615, partial [Hyphomicrobiaceae bacterium]